MSTQIDSSLFVDVADAIGLGNPAIVEKDYYVAQLLKLISVIQLEYYQLVFTGGTALAKSAIKMYRMSEDIDIKLVPNQAFEDLTSRRTRRDARRVVKQYIESLLAENGTFSIEKQAKVNDEYRYFSFDIRYPQAHQQAPCLRPYIKLEFIESDLLDEAEFKSIQSIYAEVLKYDAEVKNIACAAILETQAEKLLSTMRRTASVARNNKRDDDETLIRHVYDTYLIQQSQPANVESLGNLVAIAIELDVERFGNQHPQMVESPIDELRFGLQRLIEDSKYEERYNSYVSPMVYAESPVNWHDALAVFTNLANEVLDYIGLGKN